MNKKLRQELERYSDSPYAVKTFRVFSKIPNTEENLKMLSTLKKHIDVEQIRNMRWKGQCVRDDLRGGKVNVDYGVPLKHSQYIKVFIDVR